MGLRPLDCRLLADKVDATVLFALRLPSSTHPHATSAHAHTRLVNVGWSVEKVVRHDGHADTGLHRSWTLSVVQHHECAVPTRKHLHNSLILQ